MAVTAGSTTINLNGHILSSNVVPTGTLMLFQQTNAPTGWTKQTTHNDKTFRIVNGTVGSGGSVAFTTAFASRTPAGSVTISGGSVGASTVATTQMASHSHTFRVGGGSSGPWNAVCVDTNNDFAYGTSGQGSTSSHTHGYTVPSATFTGSALDFAVQYVDTIIASKD